jgi:hypothetical protein
MTIDIKWIIKKQVELYVSEVDHPTVKGFIRYIDLKLSYLCNFYGVTDENKLFFFKQIKSDESTIRFYLNIYMDNKEKLAKT